MIIIIRTRVSDSVHGCLLYSMPLQELPAGWVALSDIAACTGVAKGSRTAKLLQQALWRCQAEGATEHGGAN